MILIVSLTLLLLEIFVCYKNIKYGLCFILIITFLIPNIVSFSIAGINLNVFNLSIIIILLLGKSQFKQSKLSSKSLKKTYSKTILYFYTISFFITIGSYGVIFFFKHSLLNFLEFYAIGFLLLYVTFEKKEITIINKTLTILAIITSLYAIFNYVTKTNPYLTLILLLTGAQDMVTSFLSEQRGALDGRVSSTFMHPLILGEMMLLTFSYLYYQLKKTKTNKIVYILTLTGCFISTVLTGSRSALIPILFVPFFHFLFMKKKQLIKAIFGILIILPILYHSIPQKYQETIDGMIMVWDSNKSKEAGISGSSSEMRNNQLMSAFKIIEDNIFFGKGNGYIRAYGDKHPEMLGYEGLFLYTIVEFGLVGSIVFICFFFYLTYFLYKNSKTKMEKAQSLSLCVPFFVCISLTGIQYSIFSFFILLYFLTYHSYRTEARILQNQYTSNSNIYINKIKSTKKIQSIT